MGTSGGGAGGGSGGSGGGGGGGGGSGTITVSRGALKEVDPTTAKANAAFQKIFSRLSTDYLGFMAGDPGLVQAYEALHTLHVLLGENKSWKGVEEQFGVAGGKGCLRALAEALSSEEEPANVHPRVRAPLYAALMDFFRRIVGGDPVVPQNADAAEVLAKLNPTPFQSTSALFFGSYLTELLRLEDSSVTTLDLKRRRDFALQKANQIVAAFDRRFRKKSWKDIGQVGFRDFLRVIQGESGWLAEQLRKEL
jgi:hypothetical protein